MASARKIGCEVQWETFSDAVCGRDLRNGGALSFSEFPTNAPCRESDPGEGELFPDAGHGAPPHTAVA